jgi:hypothetical protein
MMFRKLVLLFLGVCSMSLFGCRTVHHYGYEYVELDLFGGLLAINTIGDLGKNYEKEGKKLIDYSFPYYIQFTYVADSSGELSRVLLSDVELIGEKTKSRHVLGDFESDSVKVYGEKKQIRFSAGPLSSGEYEYQNYTLKATVTVYKGEEVFEKKEISVEIKTEYRTERRSDWFDEKMSV